MILVDFDETKRLIETFFNGKFEVKKFLGEGSFAKVYLVNHNYLDTLMAMKIIKEPLSVSTNKKSVFKEVTLACQLRHENIISIYDAAEISMEDGKNHAYFLMEYVSGGDLEQYLNSFIENDIFMSIDRSMDLIKQILMGLDTLHSANPPIVHHDLKLNNVLLGFNSCGEIIIKISDFGFAKEVTTSISDIDIEGTRPYMAPELFKKSISTKSDIYAIGVIFYQLLTNRYPYDVDKYGNDDLIDLKPWREDLKPPSHYNNHVFDELDDIVLKCLDIDLENRYSDASDLLEDVLRVIDKYKSTQIISKSNIIEDYSDDYDDYILNDSLKKAFELAKCENRLNEAIEILEKEILSDFNVRKFYSETLRIWKSKRPDLKLISKAFTVTLKGKNYLIACNLLKEAIAYNPSLKGKYKQYIDLWKIFMDLEKHKSIFKAIILLENLMEDSREMKEIYQDILPTLKTCSIEEIVAESLHLINLNKLSLGSSLMEFAVICDGQIREKYEYRLSLWKQNMKMHFKQSSEPKDNAIDYAIDLGTTDSLISYFNKGNPIMIKNHRTGEDFTPSAILIDDLNNLKVGSIARNEILEDNPNAVSEFKNDMGFSVPYLFENSSKIMFPEELSAEVLKDLRVSAYNDKGVNIEHAVICVPANSNPMKTRAVNEAAQLAGFRSHSLILEPIAVSLAYNLKKDNGIWMIYDLGGGTFNVTLIKDNKGEIEKLATDGLENFGGNSFDWKIVDDLFKPKIAYELNLADLRRDNQKYVKVFAKLKNAAEIAKIELSKDEKTEVFISNLFDGYDFNYELTRNQLMESIQPLIKYTFNLCRNLLEEQSLLEKDIDKIILVGGSSLSPIVKQSISNEFDIEIESRINPLTVVARGAAIYAGSLEKPNMKIKKHPLSVLIEYENNQIKGKVFSKDLKLSFLGYSIEFKNEFSSVKMPLNIDGTFKFTPTESKYEILIYEKEKLVKLNDMSPVAVNHEKVFIPYFNQEFDLQNDLMYGDLIKDYSELLKEIEYLNNYAHFGEHEILHYLEILFEIAQRDGIALNHIDIYIRHLSRIVKDAKIDLEFSMLCENVLRKIEIVKENNLFEIENADEIIKDRNLDKLKEYYSNLMKKYVLLNKNDVIRECFFNLKLDGIYPDENAANDLIEEGQAALNTKDYEKLFSIVNRLYGLDEREEVVL